MSKLRLLLVEDDGMDRLLVSKYLAAMPDCEFAACASGQEALARLQRGERFDVILVDWMMPGMSGYELLRTVRANAQFNGIRIMMITAKEDLEDVRNALAAGAGEYLMKPFTREMLVGKIQLLFSQVT